MADIVYDSQLTEDEADSMENVRESVDTAPLPEASPTAVQLEAAQPIDADVSATADNYAEPISPSIDMDTDPRSVEYEESVINASEPNDIEIVDMQPEPAIELINPRYDSHESREIYSILGAEDIEPSDTSITELITEQVENIEDYDTYEEAVEVLYRISTIVDAIAQELNLNAIENVESVINISDFDHIDQLREEVTLLLELLGHDADHVDVSKFIELLIKDKLVSSNTSLQISASIDSVDEGTHETKLDQPMYYSSVDDTHSQNLVHYVLGKFALAGII